MKTVFTLTSAESRRLIAKGVVSMPEFKAAWEKAYVILAGGTTNAFIAQELLGRDGIEPQRCTAGISSDGVLCVTDPDSRNMFPNVFYKSEKSDLSIPDAISDYHDETVIIKGANAFDMNGYVGIITAGFDGGTVVRFLGTVTSKGLKLIVPVGLEKLVPSVQAASKALAGASHIDISMGADCGMYCIGTADIVTEIEAIKLLFGCDASLVCCGGVGGNEGAVTLAVDGDEENIKALVDFLEKEVKGEPPVPGNKGNCETCNYKFCRYNGLKKEELPAWMTK